MHFADADKRLTVEEIRNVEFELGISFPESLRHLFLNHNGGSPEPYVFQDEWVDATAEEQWLDTVVSETLPLISGEGRDTAVHSYQLLVVERHIVATNLFPFAVDGGGDYFFVDCDTPSARVYFYRSDVGLGQDCLVDLNRTLDEFWDCLQPEE